MTRGEQIRDFTPVDLVAQELLHECENCSNNRVVVRNLGTGNPVTVREFCDHWWKTWNAKGKLLVGHLPYRDGEGMRYIPLLDEHLLSS